MGFTVCISDWTVRSALPSSAISYFPAAEPRHSVVPLEPVPPSPLSPIGPRSAVHPPTAPSPLRSQWPPQPRRNRVSRAKSYPPCAPGTEQPTQQSRLKEEEAEETPRRRKSQHRKHRDGPTDPSVLVCRCSSWNKEHEKSVQRVQCCAYQMD